MDLTHYVVQNCPDDDHLFFYCMMCEGEDGRILYDDDGVWPEPFNPEGAWLLSDLLRMATLHAAREHARAYA